MGPADQDFQTSNRKGLTPLAILFFYIYSISLILKLQSTVTKGRLQTANILHNPNSSLSILRSLSSQLLLNTWSRLQLRISMDIFLNMFEIKKSQNDHDGEKV